MGSSRNAARIQPPNLRTFRLKAALSEDSIWYHMRASHGPKPFQVVLATNPSSKWRLIGSRCLIWARSSVLHMGRQVRCLGPTSSRKVNLRTWRHRMGRKKRLPRSRNSPSIVSIQTSTSRKTQRLNQLRCWQLREVTEIITVERSFRSARGSALSFQKRTLRVHLLPMSVGLHRTAAILISR